MKKVDRIIVTSEIRIQWVGLMLVGLAIGFATLLGCDSKGSSSNSAGGPSSGGSKGVKRIILLNNTESPFWDAAREGIKKAVADLKLKDAGFDASMDANDGTEQGQVEKLRQYGTQRDIVAVVISPTSSTNPAIAEELGNLAKKGVIIGCFDSDLDAKNRSVREFYVGTDNIVGGKVLGTAAKNLKSSGEYVQFVGLDSQQNAIERMNGFTEAVGPAFVQKDRRLDDADRARARDNVQDVISKYPDLSILVGIWSYNAPAIVDVVSDKKVRDKFTIVTFDAEQLAIQQMSEGMIDAMVVQNPFGMGYDSVKYAFAKATGDTGTIKEMFPNMGTEGGDIKNTGLKIVVPANNTPLKADMFQEFGPSVEFTTLPDFQGWLAKYNLTSS